MTTPKTLPRRDFLLWGAGVSVAVCAADTPANARHEQRTVRGTSPLQIAFFPGADTGAATERTTELFPSNFVRVRVGGFVPTDLYRSPIALAVRYAAADVPLWSYSVTVTEGGSDVPNVPGGTRLCMPLDKAGAIVFPLAWGATQDELLRFVPGDSREVNTQPLRVGTYIVAVGAANRRAAPNLGLWQWDAAQRKLVGKSEAAFPYIFLTFSATDAPVEQEIEEGA